MEEREKSCPSAQQVLADGPDSGLWCVCVCFRRDEMLEKKKERKRHSLHLHPRHLITADAVSTHTNFFTK